MDDKIESEIMVKNPGVRFNDIIGMKEMKQILYEIIVVPTISGKSAKLISNLEPSCPILALVSTEEIANQLALNYGIYAVKADIVNDMDKLVDISIAEAKKFMKVNKGDTIIITAGLVAGKIGFTNLMKIEEITE